MSAYEKILREVKLRVKRESISDHEIEQVRLALENIRTERGSFRGLKSKDLAKLVIVRVNGFENNDEYVSPCSVPENDLSQGPSELANEYATLDDNNNSIKSSLLTHKEDPNGELACSRRQNGNRDYDQTETVKNAESKIVSEEKQNCSGDSEASAVVSGIAVAAAVTDCSCSKNQNCVEKIVPTLIESSISTSVVFDSVCSDENHYQAVRPERNQRRAETLETFLKLSSVSNVDRPTSTGTEQKSEKVTSCVKRTEDDSTSRQLNGTACASGKPQRQRHNNQKSQQSSSVSILVKSDQSNDKHNFYWKQMSEELTEEGLGESLPNIEQTDSNSAVSDVPTQPLQIEPLNGDNSAVQLPSNIRILPSNQYSIPTIESGSLMSGRVLMRDFIPHVIEKCGGLDPSYWEVVTILSSFWREDHPEGFDRFRSPDLLFDEVKKRLIENREFKKVVDKISSIDKSNSICNGEYFISPTEKLNEKLENIASDAKSSNDFLASCNFLNSNSSISESAKSSCKSSKSISASSSLDLSSSLEGAVFSNVIGPVPIPNSKDVSPQESSYEREVLTSDTSEPPKNFSCKSALTPRVKVQAAKLLGKSFSKPPFPRIQEATRVCVNLQSNDAVPPGFGDLLLDKNMNPLTDIGENTNKTGKKLTEAEATNTKPQLKPSLSDMGHSGSTVTSSPGNSSTGDQVPGYMSSIERLPLLQRRGSVEGKTSCRQCANSLVPGKGKLEMMSCGHWLHQSCQRMNSTGCPTSCSRQPSTANSLVSVNQPMCEQESGKSEEWQTVPVKKAATSKTNSPSETKVTGKKKGKKGNGKAQVEKLAKTASDKTEPSTATLTSQPDTPVETTTTTGSEQPASELQPTTQYRNSTKIQMIALSGPTAWKQISVPTTFEQDNSTECPICMSAFDNAPSLELACKHKFHGHCLRKWISCQGSSCPICRRFASQAHEFPALQ